MYRVAITNRSRYHHLYEWDKTGSPASKLWVHTLSGGVGARQMSWYFRPDTTRVPETTTENTDGAVPESVVRRLRKNGEYLFPNKAMVFESGRDVRIEAKGSSHMLVPLREEKRFIFLAKGRSVLQHHRETKGALTTYYVGWISANADYVFERWVRPRIEKRIRKVYLSRTNKLGGNNSVRRGKSKGKTAMLSAIGEAKETAFTELSNEMRQAVREAEVISNA